MLDWLFFVSMVVVGGGFTRFGRSGGLFPDYSKNRNTMFAVVKPTLHQVHVSLNFYVLHIYHL